MMLPPDDPHSECKEYQESLKFKIRELEQKIATLEDLVQDADRSIDNK